MGTAIVLIISHKPSLTQWEVVSLRQCVRVLGQHPIRLICPQGLDRSVYDAVVPEIPIEYVDGRWLESYGMFNTLKVSPFLYEKFSDFEHILFYEPDAFVFSDQLAFWCEQPFDYIGAPWFEGFVERPGNRFIGVGNGGFSLRNVDAHLRIAKDLELRRFLFGNYYRQWRDKIRFLGEALARFGGNNPSPSYYLGPIAGNEDLFWGWEAPRRNARFRVATPLQAIPFSFEAQPRLLFEMNAGRLPFGCHGWFKYDLPFWAPFIREFGYEIETQS